MDTDKRERCRAVFSALPDKPKIVGGGYDPAYDIILMPINLEDSSAYYWAVLFHEYFHKKLYEYDLRDFFSVSSDDFWAAEEVTVEASTSILLNSLSVFTEVKTYQINYIREWKNKIADKALTAKLFPVLKVLTEPILDQEITKRDLPIEIRVLLGLF